MFCHFSLRRFATRLLAGWLPSCAAGITLCLLAPFVSHGQVAMVTSMSADDQDEVRRDGPWEIRQDPEHRASILYRVLKLAPQPEAQPALSIQLIPNEYHRKPGNAATFYMQAMGFFEQSAALEAKLRFERSNMEEGNKVGKRSDEVPPYVWMEIDPAELPIEEVKNYLTYTSFQPRYLAEAVQRGEFSLDRRIKEVGDFIGTLLPEIQYMRDLARQQSLRFRLAMAEDRIEDAVAILGQQLAMGSHLGQDHFMVSALVGMACVSIGMSDAYYLCEHHDAPNLYWAMAALPQPLVDLRHSLAYEREVLFLQFKKLEEIDETPKPDSYWQELIPEYAATLTQLGITDMSSLGEFDESSMTLLIAMGVPGAKHYLRDVVGMTDEALSKLSNTHLYFLAVRRYWEITRDKVFKTFYAPERQQAMVSAAELGMGTDQAIHGLITVPTGLLLPAVEAAAMAQRRSQQQVALMQTIESIRHHLATHDNAFPQKLADLELPAPLDPVSSEPFNYELHSEGATLRGAAVPGVRYQLELRAP